MTTKPLRWISALPLALAGFALFPACVGAPQPDEVELPDGTVEPLAGKPGICSILCLAPPEGCEYKGGLYTGPCNAVRCGHLVCNDPGNECPVIDCAAPPEGCHYEGMVTSPCNQQTCGQLVCTDPL